MSRRDARSAERRLARAVAGGGIAPPAAVEEALRIGLPPEAALDAWVSARLAQVSRDDDRHGLTKVAVAAAVLGTTKDPRGRSAGRSGSRIPKSDEVDGAFVCAARAWSPSGPNAHVARAGADDGQDDPRPFALVGLDARPGLLVLRAPIEFGETESFTVDILDPPQPTSSAETAWSAKPAPECPGSAAIGIASACPLPGILSGPCGTKFRVPSIMAVARRFGLLADETSLVASIDDGTWTRWIDGALRLVDKDGEPSGGIVPAPGGRDARHVPESYFDLPVRAGPEVVRTSAFAALRWAEGVRRAR